MCILVLKEKGVQFPSEREVINCMNANPDGFAMAFNDNYGEIKVFKSMDRKKFLKAYQHLVNNYDYLDTALMMHMRIATHGSVGVKNCHCWTGDILGTEMAFAHNGILRIPNRDDMTDSETFLRDYLESCDTMGEFLSTVNDNIGTSKFGFIDGDGEVLHFGNFITSCGILYSNASFQGKGFSRIADPRLWNVI